MTTQPVPPWLATMREITGTKEVQGAADSPIIMAWRDEIARRYPDMAAYCAQYSHDAIAWCGLTVAYCMAKNGIKPVKEFLWADNWRKFGTKLSTPRLGCILTFKRSGGNHVAFYEGEEGDSFIIRGGNQSDMVSVQKKKKSELTGMAWPGEVAGAAADDSGGELVAEAPRFGALVAGGYFSATPFDKLLPASIRTNNPGALNIAPWIRELPGYVGDKVTSMSGASPNSTVIFSAPEYGVAAWWKLLQKYRAAGAVTVGQIIDRYGGGQDYSAYVASVAEWSGLDENDEIVLDADDQLLHFARAMFRYEAGRTSPLSDEQILFGFTLARGGATAPAIHTTTAAPLQANAPIASPALVPAAKKKDGVFAAVVTFIAAALAVAYTWLREHLPEIIIGVAVLAVVALVIYRLWKGHWPWTSTISTGAPLPVPLLHLHPSSVASLDQLSAHLAALRELSPARPSPEFSASPRRPARSVKRSRKIRAPRKNSKGSKPNTRTRSLRTRKSRSKR